MSSPTAHELNPDRPDDLSGVRTPALVVDLSAFDRNVDTMRERWPGTSLRPHVKAFKSTALARRLADAGHTAFCAATPREIEGMAEAGLGADLLLANETLDTERLGRLRDVASITVAVDSDATLDAAVRGGIRSVLIDVEVGLPRCGCDVDDAGRLADRARAAGLDVRGVMGYEGHLMMVKDRAEKVDRVRGAMEILLRAHDSRRRRHRVGRWHRHLGRERVVHGVAGGFVRAAWTRSTPNSTRRSRSRCRC